MKKKPTCCFLILGYQNESITRECVARLVKHLGSDDSYRIVLFDNGSKPSLRALARQYGIEYHFCHENLGFARGYNQALQVALRPSDEIVCLINNDVYINERFAKMLPETLQEFNADSSVGMMQPSLYTDEAFRQIENFGVNYYQSGLAFQNHDLPIPSSVLANGACLFVKRSIYELSLSRFGYFFTPEFYMYAEDLELCIRMRKLGYINRIETRLRAQHLGSITSGRVSFASLYLSWRNLFWTGLIHRQKLEFVRRLPQVAIGQFILFALSIRYGYPCLLLVLYWDTYRQREYLKETRILMMGISEESKYLTKGISPQVLF